MNTYGLAEADLVFSVLKKRYVEFRSDGVYLSSEMNGLDASDAIFWKYACELDGPDSPNPLTAPSLPFPFTANQLAAFMLDGVGAVYPSAYGAWENGPDSGMLESLGVLGREARRAITEAYGAYKTAQATVGSYPVDLAAKEYQAAYEKWRKAMVNELLRPVPEESPATPSPELAASDGPAPLTTAPSWSLTTSLTRAPGYRWPLYQFLKAAYAAGKPCPKARDVVDAWTLKPPPDVQAMPDGVKYNDGLGNSKEADLKAIQQAIKNLLNQQAGQAPRKRLIDRPSAG